MRKFILSIATIAFGAVVSSTPARGSTFYATQVISSTTGSPSQPGFLDTSLILGGPRGGGTGENGLHVLNLGVGGQVTVGFADGVISRKIVNESGADFIVFENSIYAAGNTARSFAELVFVEVSTDGSTFARFPVLSATAAAVLPFGTINPANVSGFAGVMPVLANVDTNSIDPFNPAVAGGDAFDLSALASDEHVLNGTVQLNDIRFIRLIDVLGDGSLKDSYRSVDNQVGRSIFDPTNTLTMTGNGGADVDAIAVIHGAAVPEPTSVFTLLAITGICAAGRRRR